MEFRGAFCHKTDGAEPMKKIIVLAAALLAAAAGGFAAGPAVVTNLAYKSGADLTDYERERCVLDLYVPAGSHFASLVWFHGGGLTAGGRDGKETRAIAQRFAEEGIAVAAPNYRLSPGAKFPAYIEDAAAAVAWVRGRIGAYGGDSNRVFVSGGSAGGYLTSMLAMDASYLRRHGFGPEALAGFIPVSGQMMTHFTVRAEQGLATNCITADVAAPIFHTRPDAPPMLILMGDHDWPARLEENQYFVAIQKIAGHRGVELKVIPDRTHGTITGRIPDPGDPAQAAMLEFIRAHGGR